LAFGFFVCACGAGAAAAAAAAAAAKNAGTIDANGRRDAKQAKPVVPVWRFALKVAASSTHWSPFRPSHPLSPPVNLFLPSPQNEEAEEEKTSKLPPCLGSLIPLILNSPFFLLLVLSRANRPANTPRARPSCPPFPTYTAHASFFPLLPLQFPHHKHTPRQRHRQWPADLKDGYGGLFGSLQLLLPASSRDQFVSLSRPVADRPNRNHFFLAQQISIEASKVSRLR
jgi:hypothetical protein